MDRERDGALGREGALDRAGALARVVEVRELEARVEGAFDRDGVLAAGGLRVEVLPEVRLRVGTLERLAISREYP